MFEKMCDNLKCDSGPQDAFTAHFLPLIFRLFFLFSAFIFSEGAFAFQVNVLLLDDKTGSSIKALEIAEDRTKATFSEVTDPDKFPLDEDLFKAANFSVEIFAKVKKIEGFNIMYNNKLVQTSESGRFVLKLPLRKEEQWFDISGISDTGKVETQRIGVRVENLKEFAVYLRERKTPIRVKPSLGGHYLSYSQKNVPAISQMLLSGGLYSVYGLDPGNIEAHLDMQYLYPIVDPDPKLAEVAYLKSSAYLTKQLEFEWLPSQIRHLVLGGGFFLHYLMVEPRLFGYSAIGGLFGDLLTSFNLGRAYNLDLTIRYGTFPWGGDISGFWSRRLGSASIGFARAFVTGSSLRFTVDVEQVTVDLGDVSVFFGGLTVGYTMQL